MEWFVAAIIVAIVCSWKLRGKSAPATKFKKIDSDESTRHKKEDDFAGNSVGAFFLMEEFAGPGTESLKPEGQHIFDDDYSDCSFIEEDFLE